MYLKLELRLKVVEVAYWERFNFLHAVDGLTTSALSTGCAQRRLGQHIGSIVEVGCVMTFEASVIIAVIERYVVPVSGVAFFLGWHMHDLESRKG
jgi:hypothetical protein